MTKVLITTLFILTYISFFTFFWIVLVAPILVPLILFKALKQSSENVSDVKKRSIVWLLAFLNIAALEFEFFFMLKGVAQNFSLFIGPYDAFQLLLYLVGLLPASIVIVFLYKLAFDSDESRERIYYRFSRFATGSLVTLAVVAFSFAVISKNFFPPCQCGYYAHLGEKY